jgi:hypothetical protein
LAAAAAGGRRYFAFTHAVVRIRRLEALIRAMPWVKVAFRATSPPRWFDFGWLTPELLT